MMQGDETNQAPRSKNRSEIAIIIILRTMGCSGLLAAPVVFFPFSWMATCHEALGLGTMPETAIVSYLARSLSAFYAVVGVITVFVSLDIRRYRSLLKLWAIVLTVLGCTLLAIDLMSLMPIMWTLAEGPPVTAIGLLLWRLQKHISSER